MIENWTFPSVIREGDLYRYARLARWAQGPLRVYVGLSPVDDEGVTHDHLRDLCDDGAFGGYIETNCFNLRSSLADECTNPSGPSVLVAAGERGVDLIGPQGDELFQAMLQHPHVAEVVACWGTGQDQRLTPRLAAIGRLIMNPECHPHPVKCFGMDHGNPRHIWRVDRGMALEAFRP